MPSSTAWTAPGVTKRFGRGGGALGPRIWQHGDELFRAPASDEVGASGVIAEPAGDRAEYVIPGGVAEAIVDRLEVVDVDDRDGERTAGFAGE